MYSIIRGFEKGLIIRKKSLQQFHNFKFWNSIHSSILTIHNYYYATWNTEQKILIPCGSDITFGNSYIWCVSPSWVTQYAKPPAIYLLPRSLETILFY